MFALLRFVTVFAVLLLLVNPKFDKTTYYTEKPDLVVAMDNSESVVHLDREEEAKRFLSEMQNNSVLNDRFNIQYYGFGKTVQPLDSLNFTENQTQLDKVFREFSQVYKNTVSPTVLVSDGNQTYGNDYQFATQYYKQPVYPVILGDTITHTDVKVSQLNVNKYAYLKNRFPMEVILNYSGTKPVTTRFSVKQGRATVYSEQIQFSKTDNSKILNFTLPANSVGVKVYKAEIGALETEKNTQNNSKDFAVEVIDQKTRVAIVGAFLHPDMGMLKKSIESNQQREVELFNINSFKNQINDFEVVVLFEPNNNFNSLIERLNQSKTPVFTICGPETDWQFLNETSLNYTHDETLETETYQASLNSNFLTFIVDDIGFESFPPLESTFGEAYFTSKPDVVLYKKLRSAVTEQPLLATFENDGKREVLLLGINLWQWRAQSFINEQSFQPFDDFIGKLIQYLSSSQRKERLNIDYNSFYDGSKGVIVRAQYFNKNYEPDTRETLNISVKNRETDDVREFPFILKNSGYQVDLSSLPAGEYSFTVSTATEKLSKSGQFTVLEYNVEQQFLNADVTKLQALATNSQGTSYFIADYAPLFDDLLNDDRYLPVQKSNKKTVPLIDFKILLALIALCLSAEWFLRKYKGLV